VKRLLCLIIGHAWTSRAAQGLPPSPEDLPQPGDKTALITRKFNRFATVYCSRCGKVYHP